MSVSSVFVKEYPAPPVNEREIYRYACCAEASAAEKAMMESCLAEALPLLSYRLVYCQCSCRLTEEGVDLDFARPASQNLKALLAGCDRVILFGATLGLELDRLIAKAGKTDPVRGLFFQAIGAERIEALCEAFCDEKEAQLRGTGAFLTPRYSPGYGDLPLAFQKNLFRVLEGSKIGLSLNESLLMSPSKSVTALMGIGENAVSHGPERCRSCFKTDCAFRKV